MRKTAVADSAAYMRRKRKSCRRKWQASKFTVADGQAENRLQHLPSAYGQDSDYGKERQLPLSRPYSLPVETPHTETAAKSLWASPLTFQLRSGDRLSLKGKNGSGKTTLLKLIMGELHPTDGVMERADFTSVYLDQEYSLVRNERSVLQQAEAFNHRHLPEHEVKTILNRYLFPRDVWNKPCGKLSGGEKMRLSFCCLMIADNTPDMFILDEPTNNLDIESIEIITATIRDYAGTVIAISHDREFLKDTGIEREILLE